MIHKSTDIEEFVAILAESSQEGSNYHPVDRSFLEPYIERIFSYDLKDFIFYNIENTSDLYACYLFLCLPEVWDKIEVTDIIEISHRLSKEISFYTLIKFTYKYLEIDLLELFLSDMAKDRKPSFLNWVVLMLERQYNVMIKSEYEIEDYREDENWGIDLDRWSYIKQRMLLDKRVKPALQNTVDLKRYIDRLLLKYK